MVSSTLAASYDRVLYKISTLNSMRVKQIYYACKLWLNDFVVCVNSYFLYSNTHSRKFDYILILNINKSAHW